MYFLNLSTSKKLILFCVTFFINLSVISQAAVIPQENPNQIVNYQSFRDIPITSELSNTGTIRVEVNDENVNQNIVSNIFLGSLDNNSERNIHFKTIVNQGVLSSFTVTFLYGKGSKSYDFYVSSDNEINKNTQDFNNIKIVYMSGHIQIFYGNKKTWKGYYPDFTIENIRIPLSHGASDVTLVISSGVRVGMEGSEDIQNMFNVQEVAVVPQENDRQIPEDDRQIPEDDRQIPEDDRQITVHQKYKEIPVPKYFIDRGAIYFSSFKFLTDEHKNSVSHIIIGTFDSNVEPLHGNNIHFKIISDDNQFLVNFIVESVVGDKIERYYSHKELENGQYTKKYYFDKLVVRMFYLNECISIFYQNEKIAEFYYPNFKAENIRFFSSNEPFSLVKDIKEVYLRKLHTETTIQIKE